MLLFCIDGTALDAHKLEPILEAFPQAEVLVRTFDRRHVMRMDGVDVAGIYREVFESAVAMGRDALLALGVEAVEARRVERAYRERDAERLAEQSRSGDLATLKERIFRPGGDGLDDNEGVFDSDKPADPAMPA